MSYKPNSVSHKNRLLVRSGAALLAGGLALTGCATNSSDTAPSNSVTASSTSPETSATPSPVESKPIEVQTIDARITGFKTTEEAVAELQQWSARFTENASDTSSYLENPAILIDAAGVNGTEAQSKAVNAMANDIRITPKELAVNTEIMLDQIKRISPFIDKVREEESSNGAFDEVPITAASQYDATRAFAYIMAQINNGIADGTISYPEIANNCDLDSFADGITTKVTLLDGTTATYTPLLPPFGVMNSVSYEARHCLNVASTEKLYSDGYQSVYTQNIQFARDNGFVNEAKALEIFGEPLLNTNEKTEKLVAGVDN